MRAGLLAALGLFAASAALARAGRPAALPPAGPPLSPPHAVQDEAAVLAGARRAGGGAAFVQLLQYLSSEESHSHAEGEEHGHTDHYPGTLLQARRVAAVSPYFHEAALYAGGVLGFVLNRPREALDFLGDAARRDPTFWRYRLYAGAIGYRMSEEPEKVVQLLEEALKYPDCPAMLKNILANLHKKRGNPRRAAEIYLRILETSRDVDEINTARRQLETLIAEGRLR